MTVLLGIFTFFKTNIKWVAIIVVTLVLSLGAWKLYSVIQENARSKAEIERLTNVLVYKDLAIDLYKSNIKSVEEALKERDLEIRDQLEKIKDLSTDLPPDVNDDAPPSTQEYINRLRKILP